MATIFIFAYYSFYDPVFQSAVLPYFTNFPEKDKFRFILITFEQKKYRTDKEQRKKIKDFLLQHNIIWYNVNWHSGKFKLIKKAYDFLLGFCLSSYIIVRYRVQIIYSEAFPGAIISHMLSKIFRKPHMVHSFEPHTQYMVEAGVWNQNSWEAKLLSKFERVIAKNCACIFTATNEMIIRLRQEGVNGRIERVASCVDLDFFHFSAQKRILLRDELNIANDECVITYLGKFGGMYLDVEIFKFYKACLSQTNLKFRFFIFSHDDHSQIWNWIDAEGLDRKLFFVSSLRKEEIPAFLSASDFGLVPVRQNQGKRYCSPIKDGEYWACGLPIIIPEGISDDYIFAEEHGIGICIKDFSKVSLSETAKLISFWWNTKDFNKIRQKARLFVNKDRNVQSIKQLYLEVFRNEKLSK